MASTFRKQLLLMYEQPTRAKGERVVQAARRLLSPDEYLQLTEQFMSYPWPDERATDPRGAGA